MSRRARLIFFLFSAAGFLGLYLWGLHGLPSFGHYRGPYGDVLNAVTVYERHTTDVVTAVNFDYRGFDTLGEEFILFASVMGVLLLLRRAKDEQEDEAEAEDEKNEGAEERATPQPSDATTALTLGLVGPLVLFGIYIVAHGQLTPGGGFQGGVILASAPLMVYLAGSFEVFKRITSHTLVEIAEAVGAAGYVLIGLFGIVLGGQFLRNVLPLGQTGDVFSSGTIALISLTTGLEVTAGFTLLLYAWLEETLAIRLGWKP